MSRALLPRTPVPSGHALVLLGVYALAWLLLAVDPRYREDWALENVLVVAAVIALPFAWRRLPLSWPSCIGLFVFGLLHAVGAHYTYAEVPYDAFARQAFGFSPDAVFGLQRNSFDRLVHFCYGLLLVPTCVELLDRVAPPRGPWRYLLPVSFIMSHALLFEIFEWLAASMFGGDLGQAYLGTQGDEWDAQKDMLLATVGAALSVAGLGLAGWLGAPAAPPETPRS